MNETLEAGGRGFFSPQLSHPQACGLAPVGSQR